MLDNFTFFALIYRYLDHQIGRFTTDLLERMMAYVSFISLALVTIWIVFQGYRALTGQLREPLIGLVVNMAKVVLIVTAATSMSVFGGNLSTFFTQDLDKGINYMFTGQENHTSADTIDKNLALTQIAMGLLDSIEIVDADAEGREKKARALFMASFGTASPPMTAAALFLMFRFGIALVVGLGPLFILCLLFDQTKDLFRRWLYYGIGTIFSMAMLSAMTIIVLDLTLRVGAASWLNYAMGKSNLLGANAEGLSSQAMQSGGIGLLLTLLLVSVPPIAALFFQGTMGGFIYASVFRPEAPSQTPGTYGMPPVGQPSRNTELSGNERIIGPR